MIKEEFRPPSGGERIGLFETVKKLIDEKEINAIVFDLDGTLCMTETAQFYFYQNFLKEFRIPYTEVDDAFRRNSKCYEQDFMPVLDAKLKKSGIEAIKGADIVDFCAKFVKALLEKYGSKMLRPEIFAMLQYVQEQNVKIGIGSLSSKETILQKLNLLGINEFFDEQFIISRDEVVNRKPNPECFTRVIESMDTTSKTTLVLEDSEIGLIAAKAAGCLTLAYYDDSPVDPQFVDFFVEPKVRYWFDDTVDVGSVD